MRLRGALLFVLALTAATACGACDGKLLHARVESPVASPAAIRDFTVLYATNCAGCHGPSGEGGVALGLGNPVYLAIADDTTLRRITANGVAGTAMPAFAQTAGGMLTDAQIDTIVSAIRARWARPSDLNGAQPPPYAAQVPGDETRGAAVYARHCASCHGTAGRGGSRAGSIVDAAYLTLVSDQSLRTTIIAGRPDIGHPDWRGTVPGLPMSPQEVSDVAAWLGAQRPQPAGQLRHSPKETP